MTEIVPPGVEDIRRAADRLRGQIVATPLVESAVLNERFGGRILFKAETLQRSGSFKFRGAYNKISALTQEERRRGVVAFSSGNHAQGVASSAAIFGIDALIAMPADAPAIKVANVKRAGAKVVSFDRQRDDRMTFVKPYIDEGRVLVPPYDDPAIIAGQGTIGLELIEQAAELGAKLDAVVSPCGGGGLIAGISLAVKDASPDTAVWGVEPANFDDTRRSLAAGSRERNQPGHSSICDALLVDEPGVITFEINRKTLSGAITVSDREAAQAMRDAATYLKLVVEPGGAVGLAALASGALDLKGKTVAVVLSGGNVDLDVYAGIMAAA